MDQKVKYLSEVTQSTYDHLFRRLYLLFLYVYSLKDVRSMYFYSRHLTQKNDILIWQKFYLFCFVHGILKLSGWVFWFSEQESVEKNE